MGRTTASFWPTRLTTLAILALVAHSLSQNADSQQPSNQPAKGLVQRVAELEQKLAALEKCLKAQPDGNGIVVTGSLHVRDSSQQEYFTVEKTKKGKEWEPGDGFPMLTLIDNGKAHFYVSADDHWEPAEGRPAVSLGIELNHESPGQNKALTLTCSRLTTETLTELQGWKGGILHRWPN
jgi:hypothetical protein